jgi:hypothetical protein
MLETSGVGRAGFRGWRARRIVGAEGARSPAWSQAGRSPRPEIAEPARRAERAEPEIVKARKLIEIHGNLAALSEQMLGTEGASGSDNRADGRGADADHRHSPGVPGGGRVCDDVLSPAAAAGASASSAAAKAGESGFSRCILGWAVQYLGITKHSRPYVSSDNRTPAQSRASNAGVPAGVPCPVRRHRPRPRSLQRVPRLVQPGRPSLRDRADVPRRVPPRPAAHQVRTRAVSPRLKGSGARRGGILYPVPSFTHTHTHAPEEIPDRRRLGRHIRAPSRFPDRDAIKSALERGDLARATVPPRSSAVHAPGAVLLPGLRGIGLATASQRGKASHSIRAGTRERSAQPKSLSPG